MIKNSLSICTFLLLVCMPIADLSASTSPAKIVTVSTKRLQRGLAVDLNFDRPVSSKTLKPLYERNFVQFVLSNTQMDSARIVSVSDTEVQKVFAYPYDADVTRVRVILKKEATWAKGRISLWNNNPKSIRLFIAEPNAAVTDSTQDKSDPVAQESTSAAVTTLAIEKIKQDVSSKKTTKIQQPIILPPVAVNETIGVKTEPSRYFLRMVVGLLGIIALFVGTAFLFKKYFSGLAKLPFGKKERMIQMIASHYIGNKKSISLIKVTNEYFVVSVCNDSISLIAKLGTEANVDQYTENQFLGGTFEKHLNQYAKGGSTPKAANAATPFAAVASESASFTGDSLDAVEISAFRASIREKVTRLKPLI